MKSASSHFWDPISKLTWQVVVFYRGHIELTLVDAQDLGMIHLLGDQCDWGRPWWCWHLDFTRFDHIINYSPFSEGCSVGPLSNGSVAVENDAEGKEVAVTEVVKHVCIPLHGVIDARVATALRQRLYGGWSLYMASCWNFCHFLRSIINLPIPSSDSITVYQQLMWEVFCDQYWERIGIHEFDFCFTNQRQRSSSKSHTRPGGRSNDGHPDFIFQPWDIRYLFFSHECSGSTSIE